MTNIEEKDTSNILNKIKRLLSMTVENGATPGEAQTAYEKARELMVKYKIEEANLDSSEKDNENIVYKQVKLNYRTGWIRDIIEVFKDNYPVTIYVNEVERKVGYPVVFGFEVDVDCVITLMESAIQYASKQADKYCNEYRDLFGTAKNIKPAWVKGFARGLETKYEEQNRKGREYALICVTDPRVDEYVNDNFKIRETSYTRKGFDVDHTTYYHGFKHGYEFGSTPIPETT